MNEQPRTRTRTRLAPGIRRASILDAATRLILRDGAAGLTMEDIATEAPQDQDLCPFTLLTVRQLTSN